MRHDKILAGAAALTLALGSVIVIPPTAHADSGAQCVGDYCRVSNSAPGSSDAGGTAQSNDNSAERKPTQQIVVTPEVPLEEQTCTSRDGEDIPCTRERDGKSEWFYAPGDCYASDVRGETVSGDKIFACDAQSEDSRRAATGLMAIPDEERARYEPAAKSGAQLAHEVIAAHEFEKFSIASLPADASDALYTKAHLWLWVPEGTQARAAGTGTPIVEEKSEGPTRVKVKYELIGVNLDFAGGDPARGAHVQCHGVGNVNTSKSALKPSPSCSYQPRVHGTYRVSGSTLWRVSWESSDASGVIVHEVPLEAKDIRVVDAAARNTKPH